MILIACLVFLAFSKILHMFWCIRKCFRFCGRRIEDADAVNSSMEDVYKEYPEYRGNIRFLVRYKPTIYIVFIDAQYDLDWNIQDDPSVQMKPLTVNQEITCKMAFLARQPGVRYFSSDQKIEYGYLLGEAFVQSCEDKPLAARTLLQKAAQYAETRKKEITRSWQIAYSLVCVAIETGMILLLAINQQNVAGLLGMDVDIVKKLEYMLCSGYGAMLSIAQRFGYIQFDCQAGRTLNALEIALKFLIAFISAGGAICLFKMGILFPALATAGEAPLTFIFLCFVAGLSERLVPSMIEHISAEGRK